MSINEREKVMITNLTVLIVVICGCVNAAPSQNPKPTADVSYTMCARVISFLADEQDSNDLVWKSRAACPFVANADRLRHVTNRQTVVYLI